MNTMTLQSIIKDLTNEYFQRLSKGESDYSMDINDFAIFAYIEKYYTKNEKADLSLKLIFEVLTFFKKKRIEVFNDKENITICSLQELSKKIYPYEILFRYCQQHIIEDIKEEDILQFIDYYNAEYTINIYNEYQRKNNSINLNQDLFNCSNVIRLVVSFLDINPFSGILKQRLLRLKNIIRKEHMYYEEQIDDIIKGNVKKYSERINIENKLQLDANDLKSHKKWKWLQDYELKFHINRESFYTLIEKLSKINYFNTHEVGEALNKMICEIKPSEFEVFILDIYNETIRNGKKRSGWFMSEKAIAFQIFIWLMHHLNTPNQFSILSKLAEKCFTKIPNVGPTSRKVGDVVLKILDESETIEGLGILLNLKSRAKYPVFRKALENSIRKAIYFTQLNPNEVEDYFINDFGLSDGRLDFNFGDFSSAIQIEGFNKVNMTWYRKDGKTQKSVPAKVKSDFPSDLLLWKANLKFIKKELSGQKIRFEGFWKKKKVWSFSNWKKYIFDHEFIRFISRSLIWYFEKNGDNFTAFWNGENFIDSNGNVITDIENTSVSLWHPVNSTVEEIQAWRALIMKREIRQPFKQAFREIYLVTDAEITTSTYSNRYLSHIVKHHTFVALAKQRKWVYESVYSYDYPFIDYSEYQVEATFDLESNYDYATTGRVYFRSTKSKEVLRVEDVPAIIFSETMRDADLFVGVTSIGNDPNWNDYNDARNYWTSYSFGDLTEVAKTRKTILENLVPRLKIRDIAEIKGKFLVVRGKLRTYKIHIGSTNILMEPNDQYLCIVPDRSKKDYLKNTFIPVEGDNGLSIILSKAFLLAEDDKITDSTITSQITQN